MATRAPLTEAEKRYIHGREKEGKSLRRIALELDCAWETARKWWPTGGAGHGNSALTFGTS